MLYLHAPNVHQGGGLSLLRGLVGALKAPAVLTLDARFAHLPNLPDGISVHQVAPSVRARLTAERRLPQMLTAEDTLLCFGNLPPLWRVPARVVVFVQNVYLLDASQIHALPWKVRLRLRVERAWLRLCLRDAEVIVQTETMADKAEAAFGRPAQVVPFLEPLPQPESPAQPAYDFIYVASGEAHKNHVRLFDAWGALAAQGCCPSLAITLAPHHNTAQARALAEARRRGAQIETVAAKGATGMAALYAQARALIYPSLFESYGLPLLEAAQLGLPIVAAERDYVRDVAAPQETFDPLSSRSIARAVMRMMDQTTVPVRPLSPAMFLERLQDRA